MILVVGYSQPLRWILKNNLYIYVYIYTTFFFLIEEEFFLFIYIFIYLRVQYWKKALYRLAPLAF